MSRNKFHYLVRAIYIPRITAYVLAVLVTLSPFVSSPIPSSVLVISGIALIYPHLAYWCTGWYFNSADGARISLLFDSVLVGLLIVINQFYLFSSVTFVAALALSSMIIARPRLMLLNFSVLLSVATTGFLLGSAVSHSASFFTDLVCSISLVVHSCLVAYLGFEVTAHLGDSRRRAQENSHQLAGIAENLGRYISPQILSSMSHRQKPIRQTNRKRLTVFFSDIEGFTELMDNLEEETVTSILNEYLNTMADIAIEHGGTVDKFMGDGIMIFFGDPNSNGAKSDALACARMALEMGRGLNRLRFKWSQEGVFSDLHMRIGMNTGYCAVGNFGSESRMDYTAVGSTVNIASRLEGKAGRDSILISHATYRLIADSLECQEQQPVSLKGIKKPIRNYVLTGELENSPLAVIEHEVRGLQVSINPNLVDMDEACEALDSIKHTLSNIKRAQQQPVPMVRLL